MPSPDQLCQKSAISGTAAILENPTFAQGFLAYSLTQKPERSGGWRRECPTDLRPPASVIVQDRLIYPLFTSLFSVYRTLLVATVRHNPEQMLGHVLGHALEQTRLGYGA
jgi:hypothetical protein